jgi:hypothetical protein
MASLATFKARFPEFDRGDTSGDALIQAALDGAALLVSASEWGALADEGIMLRTADDLANSPMARQMELVDKDGATRYSRKLRELKRLAVCGLRVF